jgi:hypothetical protein
MSAIVKEQQYSLKPSAVKAKRYTREIPSLGGTASTYNMGDTAVFYLPAGLANTFMDGQTGYLKFTIVNTVVVTTADTAPVIACDFTGSSLIRSINIYGSGGALIESIDRYGTLANVLYDAQMSASAIHGQSPLIGSLDQDYTTANLRKGRNLNTGSATVAVGTGYQYYTLCIPLLSSLFGLSEKHFPLYACSSDDIRIEVQFDTAVNAFVIPTIANITSQTPTIFSPTIVVDYIEVDDMAMGQIKSLYAGRDLVVHSTSFHTYESTITAQTSGSYTQIIPSKVMSAKNILFTWRNLGTTAVSAGYTQSSRLNPFLGALSTFNINLGGLRVPNKPITVNKASDVSQFFAELQKSFHGFGDLRLGSGLGNTGYTSKTTPAVGDAPYLCSFVAGINLDQFRGQSDVLLSGYDMSKVTTYYEANFVTATPNAITTCDAFVHHDVLLIIDANGSLTVKF